jgi:hypothetical protein
MESPIICGDWQDINTRGGDRSLGGNNEILRGNTI